MDNIPPALIPQLACLCEGTGEGAATGDADSPAAPTDAEPISPRNGARVACVTDVRAGTHLSELGPALEELSKQGVTPQILFLDSSNSVLVNRFKETRRKHPLLVPSGGILGSIAAERELLKELKARADKVIDTTDYNPRGPLGNSERSVRRQREPRGAGDQRHLVRVQARAAARR